MTVGLVTDSAWDGAARKLPPASAAAPAESAPVGRYELLTDQLGMEDQLGDMDLKVAGGCCLLWLQHLRCFLCAELEASLRCLCCKAKAEARSAEACHAWLPGECSHRLPANLRASPRRPAGSRRGITACQLDVKLPGGVPLSILEEALAAAARARAKLLTVMEAALPKVRTFAPARQTGGACYPLRRGRHYSMLTLGGPPASVLCTSRWLSRRAQALLPAGPAGAGAVCARLWQRAHPGGHDWPRDWEGGLRAQGAGAAI